MKTFWGHDHETDFTVAGTSLRGGHRKFSWAVRVRGVSRVYRNMRHAEFKAISCMLQSRYSTWTLISICQIQLIKETCSIYPLSTLAHLQQAGALFFFRRISQNCEIRLLASSCLSFCPPAWNISTPTDRFSWNFIFEYFTKISPEGSVFI